ncbi:transposase [Enterococcus sp. ALS3]|uniref:Transposase n=1 Tax=Enterococcus alishanensis TaxID=1303817 RepID=A0ABS6T9R0_9ENTE|nr:transposase [Enterococcus alishanensis]MBV7389625.1 transposase [Enterococcus alishanensis]
MTLRKVNKRLKLFAMGFILIAFLFSVSAFAKVEKSDIYVVGKYHLDTFSSYIGDNEFSLGKMLFGKNGTDFIQMITNMSFSTNKIIWQVFDFIIEKLYKGAAMDGLIHTFFQFSKNIYDQLFNVVGLGLTGLYVVYIFYLKVCKNGNQAKRTLVRFLCVVGFSILWFGNGRVTSQGEKLTKDLNTWSTAVEGIIFEATNGIDDLSVATTSEEAINQIREMYYQKAVVDPYLLLNYGTTDISELKKAGIDPAEFLSKTIKNEDMSTISAAVSDAAKEDDEKTDSYRAFIQPTKSIYKMIVGIMSPSLNVSLGIPILMIGMVRFLFQLGVLLMLLAIAFMLIVSFFPGMDYMIFRGGKTFVGFIFQKSIYSVLILVAFLVFNIIDDLITMNTIAGFIGNMFVRGIVSLIVFLKRKDILAKLGLGYADRTLSKAKTNAQNTTKEVTQTIHRGKNLTEKAILKGANIAGKIHPGIIAASQLYQRTKQQRTTPVKKSSTKPTEIAHGRKKQLPYERKQLPAEIRPTIGTPPSPLPRKVAEPISEPSKAVIKKNIPLSISSLPIDRLIHDGKTPNAGNRKLTLAQPAKNHVGKSIPLRLNTPQLIANDSLTQQITQLKQSRALVNQHTSLHSMQRVSDHSRNDRTIKMTGSSKKMIYDNPRSSDHSSSIVSGKMIEAKIGRDFTLPEGRSPQK